ncbi:hypothetical protein EXIGLDRAFT_716968 [Exidia glandulosa HHB12029]|uniref:Uncharacterized protein n=1 Tax=Exidia glandulosa HHB12029 TaxID=1314781 RepID=A0A166AN45_EXIGL|nr:hypothetical protein EXIGLDRAFT_716968 [Exidia glandulosa HHB12029]
MRGVETLSSRSARASRSKGKCHTSRPSRVKWTLCMRIFASYLQETTKNSGTRSPVASRKQRPQVVGSGDDVLQMATRGTQQASYSGSMHKCAGLRGIDGESDDSIGMTG